LGLVVHIFGIAQYSACLADREDAIRLLLANGADVNFKDNIGETPLIAVMRSTKLTDIKKCNIAEILEKYGADINAEDEFHKTPLSLAIDTHADIAARNLKLHGGNWE